MVVKVAKAKYNDNGDGGGMIETIVVVVVEW